MFLRLGKELNFSFWQVAESFDSKLTTAREVNDRRELNKNQKIISEVDNHLVQNENTREDSEGGEVRNESIEN